MREGELSDGFAYNARQTESDPTGKAPNEPGAKLDSGKILADDILRMFARSLKQVITLGTKGAEKYSLGGFLDVPDGYRRFCNAEMRHKIERWINGPDSIDGDTEVLELTAEAWNALAKLEVYLREQENK